MFKQYEINGIESLDGLYNFDTESYESRVYKARDLLKRAPTNDRKNDFLVCHDFKNNYRNDRFIFKDSSSKIEFFIPHSVLNSGLITEFCYFSHKFITIPPTNWINQMHRYGIKVYGTIITEWEEGKQRMEKFIENDTAIAKTVEKLEEIRQHFNFDGWLLNIENEVEKIDVPKLESFLKQLKEKNSQSNGKVIWYDSVINTGKLSWQNALCEKNKCFYDISDGIFLNYWWNTELLEKSFSCCDYKPENVYCGIDCFAPRSEENKLKNWPRGGFNCDFMKKTMDSVSDNFSTAVFAPGWLFEASMDEKLSYDDKMVEICKFWSQFGVEFYEDWSRTDPVSLDQIGQKVVTDVFDVDIELLNDGFKRVCIVQKCPLPIRRRLKLIEINEIAIFTDRDFIDVSDTIKSIKVNGVHNDI